MNTRTHHPGETAVRKANWRDELWQFYEGLFGKNYRNYIRKYSNKENEVVVSFHVKDDELVVIANPSSLRILKYERKATQGPGELFNSEFSKTNLKKMAPFIRHAEGR